MGNGFSWSRGSERQVAHTEQILTQVTPPGNISQVDVPSQGANTICVCKGRTIRYVMGGGGEGNSRAAGIFFRYQIPYMNFFRR